MKILTIWVWAFWLATLNHLSKTHKNTTFYAYEKDQKSLDFMKKNWENPYFFTWEKLQKNIELIENINELLPSIDLIIIAIPNQFVRSMIKEIKPYLKNWVSFLNLSKWIDNLNLKTVSDNLKEELAWLEYHYNALSWWMIANELFYWKELWAQIWYSDEQTWLKIKELFETESLKIDLTPDYKNIELFWALKNVLAIYTWYLEWKWEEYSSIWYHLCELLKDIEKIIIELGGKNDFNFSQYALWWDVIATCFWNSRNRYFWNLIWKWISVIETLEKLKQENKHAEWYETLKWLNQFIKWKKWYEELKKVINIFL